MTRKPAITKPTLKDLAGLARDYGPQGVEEGGSEIAVVMSPDDYRALRGANATNDLVAFFESWPSIEDLKLDRDRDGAQERAY